MRMTAKALAVAVPFLLATACIDPRQEPAEKALKAAESAVTSLSDEVQRLAPQATKAAKDLYAAAKAAAAREDWKNALEAAKEVPAAVSSAIAAASAQRQALERAAALKLEEAKAAWAAAQAEIGAKIVELKKEAAALTKAKKLPKGVSKDDLTKGKAAVLDLEMGYAKATEQAKTDVVAASASAKKLQTQAAEASALLGKR